MLNFKIIIIVIIIIIITRKLHLQANVSKKVIILHSHVMIIKDTVSIAAGHPHARNQYNYIFLTYEIKDFKQKRKTNMHE